MGVRDIFKTSARCAKDGLLLLSGYKAEVNTVLAVIDFEGIALSICPKHTWKKLNTDFRVAPVRVALTQTTKKPVYFLFLHFRIKNA